MKRRSIIFSVAVIFLCACTDITPVATTASTDTLETDTVNYALNEDSVKLQLDNTTPPDGFYGVTLPCTNCKGIEHTVLFNRDLSYRLEEKILASEAPASQTSGAWKPANGDIWLYKDSSVVARYTWKGDTLTYVDLKSGVRIPLRRLQNILDNETWKNKKSEGIDVFGTGTEPFWSISIDEQKSMILTLADSPVPRTFKPAKPVVTADSIVYQTGRDTARLRVVVYNRFSNDGMSDNLYPSHITVYYKNSVLQGSGVQYK